MGEPGKGAVVLISGGLDSTALLHHVARTLRLRPLHAISFDYGQRHAKELACAEWQAQAAAVDAHQIIDVSYLGYLLRDGTTLVSEGGEVPDLDDLAPEDRDQPSTYVPNRNMIFLSQAAAYAEAHGIYDVFYGAQALDEYGYWDCTEAFMDRLNAVLALNRRAPVVVRAPFVRLKKAESLAMGLALGVDFSHTWSCYRGGGNACGVCPTCVERLKAFAEAGVPDPVRYGRGAGPIPGSYGGLPH